MNIPSVSAAFRHFKENSSPFVISDVPRGDIEKYEAQAKMENYEFFKDNPFLEERIVWEKHPQPDLFHVKYQETVIWLGVAAALSYACYRVATLFFMNIQEAQSIFKQASSSGSIPIFPNLRLGYCTVQKIMYRYGIYPVKVSVSSLFLGKALSPESLQAASRVTGIVKSLLLFSGPIFLSLLVAKSVPLGSRCMDQMRFSKEKQPLDNERIDGQYHCPISGRVIEKNNIHSFVRMNNTLVYVDALVKKWISKGVIPSSERVVYDGIMEKFGVPSGSRRNFEEIVDFRFFRDSEVANMCVDQEGNFSADAKTVLGVTREQLNDFNRKVIEFFEFNMDRIASQLPPLNLKQIIQFSGKKNPLDVGFWEDLLAKYAFERGSVNVPGVGKVKFNPWPIQVLAEMKNYINLDNPEAKRVVLQAKTSAFRDLKMEWIRSGMESHENRDPAAMRVRLARFHKLTRVFQNSYRW